MPSTGLKPASPETMAAVQHAAAGLQDVKGFGLGLLQNRWNRKYNEKMYEKQRQDSLSDWQRAADYNSPQAQMARYRAAGLSPNLIYENATNSPMAQMKQAEMSNSPLPPFQIDRNRVGETIGSYQNMKLIQQQVDNLQATNENIKAQTNYTNLKALTEPFKQDLYSAQIDTERTRPDLYRSQTSSIQAKTGLDLQKYNFLSQMNPHLLNLVEKRIQNIVANTGYTQAQTKVVPGIIKLNAARLLTEQAKTAKTWQEKDNLQQAWYELNGKAFKAGIEKIYNMVGTSFNDNYLTRNSTGFLGIPESVNRVYRSIVPDWDKKTLVQKMFYFKNESLNY